MALDTQQIIDAVNSHILATGLLDRVQQHEPKSPPGNGITAATWIQRLRPVPVASGLSVTSALLVLNVRFYQNFLSEPQDAIDPNLTRAVDQVFEDWHNDFDFGGLVRNVDVFGQAGIPLQSVAGYINVSGTMYRVMTIDLPIIVNDVWVQRK